MLVYPKRSPERASEGDVFAALTRLIIASQGALPRTSAVDDALLSRARSYETAINSIPEGICVFDGDGRLVVCNRQFAEIYRLDSEQIRQGAPLQQIEGLRAIAELLPFRDGANRSSPASTKPGEPANRFTAPLGDDRTVRVRCLPTADGGWVSIHQERIETKDDRAAAELHLSLQALIDEVPDNLWVKDVESRFVIANKATAARIGVDRTDDLIARIRL